jgi:dephospho-CoA kinase
VTLLRVALTGGIATGKSWVLTRFAFLEVPTIDADTIAHDVTRASQPASADIRRRFGDGVFCPDGELDRKRLGARVFNNPEERKNLEAIVHPRVRDAIDRWFSKVEADEQTLFAVAAMPLLFETGRQGDFDHVVVTTCPPNLQLERLMIRDHISKTEARQRITAQLPVEEKIAAADFVIQTDLSDANMEQQVDEIVQILGRKSRAHEQGSSA